MAKTQRKSLITPTLKLEEETAYEIKIISEFREVERPYKGKMQSAVYVQVEHNGSEYTLKCNKVLVSTLEEKFPKQGYVNKSFEVTKHGIAKGQKYYTFSLFEI